MMNETKELHTPRPRFILMLKCAMCGKISKSRRDARSKFRRKHGEKCYNDKPKQKIKCE